MLPCHEVVEDVVGARGSAAEMLRSRCGCLLQDAGCTLGSSMCYFCFIGQARLVVIEESMDQPRGASHLWLQYAHVLAVDKTLVRIRIRIYAVQCGANAFVFRAFDRPQGRCRGFALHTM